MLGRGRECSRRLIASNLQSTIRDLQRRKARGRRGLALIEGVRLVEEALAAGLTFRGALVAPDLARTTRGRELVVELERHAVAVEEGSARSLAQAADTEAPQGIVAVVEPRSWVPDDIPLGGERIAALVIDGVQDPGNVGTLIRTAHALGAAGTIVLRGTADTPNPKALRAAMGATFRHPVVPFDDGAAILGLCFGSFLNVCILRLAKEDKKHRLSFHQPSTCPSCGQPIAWRDNIPVVSWLLLRGRCRRCGHPISLQYPIIEAVVGVLWIAAMVVYGPTVHFLAAALFGTILLGIAITDARHYLIPDEYNWAGLIIGL